MIRFDRETGSFSLGDVEIPTKVRQVFDMPGYKFESFEFLKLIDQSADGGIYTLPPNTPTQVVRITGDVVCIEQPIEGSAVFLCHRGKTGDVEIVHSSENRSFGEPLSYSKGDTVVWIAGRGGAEILNMSIPPFGDGDDMEISIGIDSQELPIKFWKEYHNLTKHQRVSASASR